MRTFDGADISIAWGTNRRKQFKVTDTLRGGSFTQVEMALTPAKPEEVKRLTVGISVDKVVLLTR